MTSRSGRSTWSSHWPRANWRSWSAAPGGSPRPPRVRIQVSIREKVIRMNKNNISVCFASLTNLGEWYTVMITIWQTLTVWPIVVIFHRHVREDLFEGRWTTNPQAQDPCDETLAPAQVQPNTTIWSPRRPGPLPAGHGVGASEGLWAQPGHRSGWD